MSSSDPNHNINFEADYYRVLDVDEDATESEIKSAYRRLVKENHPDRNKSKRAEDIFKQVQDAYEVLKDPSLKATYDASRRLVQTGLPHYQTEKNIDWGAQQIRKESGKKTARNLAIFEQVTRPRTLLLLGLPLLIGYMSFFSGDDNNYEKFKDSKPALNNRKYRRKLKSKGGVTNQKTYISMYKNPKTKQWERPIAANMSSGLYNNWEVKSVEVNAESKT